VGRIVVGLVMGHGVASCGGASGRPLTVPDPVVDGDVKVACTVACDEKVGCAQATVFVSACAQDQPGLCYDVQPADAPGGGNTYVVSLGDDGESEAIAGTKCAKAAQGANGNLPVDLLFVIDTTSSMSAEIAGVVSSVDTFVDGLAARGVAARIGGIAFGDKAPLPNCGTTKTPFAPFTTVFGAGTETDPASFNHWVTGLGASYCGDGGGDGPENALDAVEFALGNDPNPADAFPATAFAWSPSSLHVIVLITDVAQHQRSEGTVAHFDLAEVKASVAGFAVVHVVAPNFGCYNTPAAGCACDVSAACDAGCSCDLQCATPGCPADVRVGVCDDPTATCDRDCAGFPAGSDCDLTANRCDPALDAPTLPCATDVDCAGGVAVGTTSQRRCTKRSQAPYADPGELALATGGAFTPLPSNGKIDLTRLPLTGVLAQTSKCVANVPANATAVRCVYLDAQGHKGEATVAIR
jgi:hypothetical protein